jgi:GNAT superfamily N-acetyltransferase
VVRPLEPRDLSRFVVLVGQLGYPATEGEAADRLARQALRDDTANWVFDDPEHGVVGWIGCRIVEQAYLPPYGEVSGLVVDENHRSRGAGAALLAAAEGWFESRGIGVVQIRSGSQREAAHRFYDREGYSRLKTQVVFRKLLNEPGRALRAALGERRP